MGQRRRVRLDSVGERARFELLSSFVLRLKDDLERRFSEDQGYRYTVDSRAAPCVDPRKHSPESQAECRMTRVAIGKGRFWGLGLAFTPEDIAFRSVKIVVHESLPLIDKARGMVVGAALVLGIVTAVVAVGLGLWEGGVEKPRAAGVVLGAGVALVAALAGLLLLWPLRALAAVKMRPEVKIVAEMVDDAWKHTRGMCPGLGPLARPWPPFAVLSIGLALTAGGGGACLWLCRQPSTSQGLVILLGVLLSVLALAALTMLIGLACAVLGLLD